MTKYSKYKMAIFFIDMWKYIREVVGSTVSRYGAAVGNNNNTSWSRTTRGMHTNTNRRQSQWRITSISSHVTAAQRYAYDRVEASFSSSDAIRRSVACGTSPASGLPSGPSASLRNGHLRIFQFSTSSTRWVAPGSHAGRFLSEDAPREYRTGVDGETG